MSRHTLDDEAEDEGSSFLPAFVAGLAVGGILGLLLAPRPGRETLGVVLDKAEGFGERISTWVAGARESIMASGAKAGAHHDGRGGSARGE